MFHPGKPSPSKNRLAENAGRALLVALLGAAMSLAAAAGILGLRGIGGAPEGMVVTLAKAGPESPGGGDLERSYVAFSESGSGSLHNLTKDFHSAFSSSVSYDGRRFLFAGRQTPSDAPAIWERGIDGSHLRKVTGGNGDPAGPVYLADGSILYSDLPAPGERSQSRSLFACAPDGSGVRRLTFGDQQDLEPRLLPDGRIRFQRRILSPPGLPSTREMVIHPDGTGLALLAESAGQGQASPQPDVEKPRGGDRVLFAMQAAPRAVPPVLTSVIRTEWKTGTLLCLDVYNSRLPAVAELPRGSIRRVRVTTRSAAGEELSGEAPVMSDGSFFVEVPADTPLRIHLLGDGGETLASFESGIWVRPNENHGCIGCHEAPEMAPENRQPLAVQRPPVSLLLALTPKGGDGGR